MYVCIVSHPLPAEFPLFSFMYIGPKMKGKKRRNLPFFFFSLSLPPSLLPLSGKESRDICCRVTGLEGNTISFTHPSNGVSWHAGVYSLHLLPAFRHGPELSFAGPRGYCLQAGVKKRGRLAYLLLLLLRPLLSIRTTVCLCALFSQHSCNHISPWTRAKKAQLKGMK